ncbi:hypothetical protein [Streptomyces reniochalinae]|uniref:Uncharacterized protein n=1 Tax=Streptomyces reniochalinae TaxID=2250578 RepID=A0A367F0Y2_9ACTN|nr:hypothetical protein [Streptomyces reniochalinae]RCG23911.1 hypothetical protein DQ392_04345 [Streptomyces reniochalinae]
MIQPSWDTIHPSEQLAGTPAVRRDGHWWLVAPNGGAVPTNEPALTRELDSLAVALDAANRAVAHLGTDESEVGRA